MYQDLFTIFNDENLPGPLRALKLVGKGCFICAFIGIAVIKFNHGHMGGTPFLDLVTSVMAWSFMLGVASYVVVGIASFIKNRNSGTTNAIVQTLRKVFLYMFLPAIVVTFILVIIFVLPRYR